LRTLFLIPIACLVLGQGAHAVAVGEVDASATATNLDVILLIVYVSLALVLSFVCSVAEAVLLSITPSYIASLKEASPKTAALLTRLKQDNVDQSLAAILTLNTIAHTVGAIGSGAKASVVFGSAWFGLFSAVMTLFILFLSEIIPKTLGAVYWRSLAALTARFVRLLIVLLYPLIYLSERLTRLIARGKEVHAFNREEFVALASLGEEDGHLDESESRILKNLFRFRSLCAKDIMTPRTVIQALPSDATVEQAIEQTRKFPFSRVPIYDGDLDQVTGFILRDDLLMAGSQDQGERELSKLNREILIIPEECPLLEILDTLLDKSAHIAIVVGEYGGTKGLVTLEDVFETLLGADIVDEIDQIDNMRSYARRRWAKRARALGIEVDEPDSAPEPAGESQDEDEANG
jgi:CBS domain containing-hemolysin-like protein